MVEARTHKAVIAVEESFAAWREDPGYVAAYDALENEFERVAAKIRRSETCSSRPAGR